jgi:catechol 2,3-dioxygenase-like lactoylglutathione lyase family enzyme
MEFLALDHVEVPMPRGQALRARAFYCGVLGLDEIRPPEAVVRRGGLWFRSGGLRIHLGVDPQFVPSLRAHPAIVVSDLEALMEGLRQAGRKPHLIAPVRKPTRCFLRDPFGNRLEFVQAGYQSQPLPSRSPAASEASSGHGGSSRPG